MKTLKTPSRVTPELFEEVCVRIEEGRSLVSVCNDPDMPFRRDVNRYINEADGASDRYARACHERAEYLAELAIVESNNESTESGAVARDRLKIDTIKWFTAKVHPKKYGDKVSTDITSNGNTIAVAPIKWADE